MPESTKQILFQYLEKIRENTGHSTPIGIKEIKSEGKVFTCAELWVLFAVGAMMSKFGKNKFPISLGRRNKGKIIWDGNYEDIVKVPIGAKFILFRERDNFENMSNILDYGGKVETTFRMGLKGGIHFLGDIDHPIEIIKMHFDGYEHYQRSVDHERIVGRLTGLREYFSITDGIYSINDWTSNHTKKDCQSYEDCQLLQLTDLLVGSFRVAHGYTTNDKKIHVKIAEPVKYLTKKYLEGYARMQNSRWKGSLCMSECFLENGKWNFQSIEYKTKGIKQGNLF
ncbi:MAG: hypothetical protein KJ757_01410 [Planctomycetes bacterium]|nr:hypothetical protein [Planctomycetota bacterium]MBU2596210.1 hypothetical protein [Planctomycetota bacterium]